MRHVALARALTIALGLATSAVAHAEPSLNEARADELFRSGVQQFDAGKVDEACDAFAQSLRLDPKLGTLLNLALCHENQGKTATAWREYSHAGAWATQQGQKDRREFANQHVVALEARLSRIALQLPAAQDPTQLEVDGEPLPPSRWALPLYLDPGAHAIAASATGKSAKVVSFTVPTGPSAQTVVVPTPDSLPVAAPRRVVAKPAPDSTSHQRTIAFVVGGAGIAGLVVGTIFGLETLGKRDDIGAHCTGNVCDAAGVDAHNSAQSAATVSSIAFAVGLVGVGVGTYLYATAPADREARARTARLTPLLTSHGGGMGLGGTW